MQIDSSWFKRYVLPLLVSLIFMWLLFKNVSALHLIDTFKNLQLRPLLIAFVCYLVVALFRGLRVHTIYKSLGLARVDAIAASLVHTLASNILPGRVGELSFIVIMKQFLTTSVSQNTVSLIFMRIFDTFVVVSLFLISFVFVGIPRSQSTLAILFLIMIGLALTAYYLDLAVGLGLKIVDYILGIHLWSDKGATKKLKSVFEPLRDFSHFREGGLFSQSLAFTFGAWVFLMLANIYMISSMGIVMSPLTILFASTGAGLTSLIPVPSLASVGTYEGGWVATLGLLGLTAEKALLIGFTVHVINFTFCLVLGILGFAYLKFRRN